MGKKRGAKKKKNSNTGIWVLAFIIIAAFLLLVTGLVMLLLPVDDGSILDGQIAVIEINGMITSDGAGSFFMEGASSEDIVEQIEAAEEDEWVSAIILDINSPGGEVVASKLIAEAVHETEKPVVSYIESAGASGAYWIAAASDWIVSDELSITGSIGVDGSYVQVEGLMDDYGVEYERLVTGKYKDVGSYMKDLSYDEEQLIMGRLEIIHDYFVSSVSEYRNMDEDRIASLATGEFFLGVEALDLGLVDQLGDFDDAQDKAEELAGIEESELVTFGREPTLFDMFTGAGVKLAYAMGEGLGASVSVEDFSLKV